jgi:phosphatidate cytidylyltransferase
LERFHLQMKSLLIRIISAVIAIIISFSLWYFFQLDGLKALVAFAVIVGSIEMIGMIFKPDTPFLIKAIFFALSLFVFGTSVTWFMLNGVLIALGITAYWVLSISLHKQFKDIQDLREKTALGTMGIIYVGVLPIFVWKLLDLQNGLLWFLTLLGVVFAGDIGAYIFGNIFGKNKVMPLLSPKKTWEGSIGGLACSVAFACFCSMYFANTNPFHMAILGLVSAIFAQLGDFFESLLKRVAEIKDSGNIMPGHGGVLDRIDGVLMAAPFFYLGAIIISLWFGTSQF